MLDTGDIFEVTGRTRMVRPSSTPVDLNVWNEDEIRKSHNCYSFALAAMGAGWSLPGDLAINHYRENRRRRMSLSVREALTRDRLTQIHAHAVSPDRGHVIAAFEKPDGWDFHVRRLSPDGTWLEKIGELEAGAVQGDHQRFGDAGDPYYFVGYFMVPGSGVPVFHPDTLHPIDVLRRHAWRTMRVSLPSYPAQTPHAAL